jgi:predicted DNA-binding protein (MmcQ/YjbR family)
VELSAGTLGMKGAKRIRTSLRTFALTFPGAHEDFPWGDCVVKVDGKIFAFLGEDESPNLRMTLKLPSSRDAALGVPDAMPTGYGLGKAGWVTFPLSGTLPPVEVLREWIEESYRAVARKTRIAEFDRKTR